MTAMGSPMKLHTGSTPEPGNGLVQRPYVSGWPGQAPITASPHGATSESGCGVSHERSGGGSGAGSGSGTSGRSDSMSCHPSGVRR